MILPSATILRSVTIVDTRRMSRLSISTRDGCRSTDANRFNGHKITVMNKLETFTLNLALEHIDTISSSNRVCGSLTKLRWVVKAAKAPRSVYIRFPPKHPSGALVSQNMVRDRDEAIESVNVGLGFIGKLERVSLADCAEDWYVTFKNSGWQLITRSDLRD
jgi:hypothetical protein